MFNEKTTFFKRPLCVLRPIRKREDTFLTRQTGEKGGFLAKKEHKRHKMGKQWAKKLKNEQKVIKKMSY
jgi:hypothetical protein